MGGVESIAAACDPPLTDPGALFGSAGELTDFERIVLHGVTELPDRKYPPPGHGYPRPIRPVHARTAEWPRNGRGMAAELLSKTTA